MKAQIDVTCILAMCNFSVRENTLENGKYTSSLSSGELEEKIDTTFTFVD